MNGFDRAIALWKHPELCRRPADDKLVCMCVLGIFMASQHVALGTMALVLDCASQKLGWCRLVFIENVK
jgi:hypothetical protein